MSGVVPEDKSVALQRAREEAADDPWEPADAVEERFYEEEEAAKPKKREGFWLNPDFAKGGN